MIAVSKTKHPFAKGTSIIITLIALMLIGTLVALYFMISTPVLFRSPIKREPFRGDSDYTVFNPFRDRNPEMCAQAFLDLIKSGQCQKAMSELPADGKYQQYICEQQANNRLASWRLKNRQDEGQKTQLYYWYWSEGSKDHERLWIGVERKAEGWKVISYECIY